MSMPSASPARDWRLRRAMKRGYSASSRVAILVGVLLAVGAMPATAFAYWDFQGNLSPGAAYGEGQAGTSGDWTIRNSRSNCNAVVEIRRRSDGVWIFVPAPNGCASTDYVTVYPLEVYNASHSINVGSSNVWVNVRIDATW